MAEENNNNRSSASADKKRQRQSYYAKRAHRRQGTARVIPAEATRAESSRRYCVVGGDNDIQGDENPPTIIVEKGEDGEISRITVKCSCGKYAELDCTYE